MRFRCERDVLVEALGTAQRAVTSRNASLPVLAGVRLELDGEVLKVTGTDLDLFLQVQCPVVADVPGVAVVPARLAAEIVRALEPGMVTVEADEDEVRISSGRASFAVRAYAAVDFPRVPTPAERAVTLPAAVIAEAIKQVVRAASTDEGVPTITGVLLTSEGDGLRLVATDKYRLAMRDIPGVAALTPGQEVLIPARALSELQRLLPTKPGAPPAEGEEATGPEVTMRLGTQEATFEIGTTRFTTRLIPSSFPAYLGLIPTAQRNTLQIGKEPLLDALRRVKLLVKDTITSVRVHLKADGITLTVASADVGTATEDVDGKYEGEDLVIAFNPAYLIDGLEAIAGDEVRFNIQDKGKAALLQSADPAASTYLYLLMPVRV